MDRQQAAIPVSKLSTPFLSFAATADIESFAV